MKKIVTPGYRLKLSQRFYDPDADPDDSVGQLSDYEWGPATDTQEQPIITPDNINEYMEDSFDDDVLSGEIEEMTLEGQPDVPVTDEDYPDFPTTEDASSWAERNGESFVIYYTTKKGRSLKREVEPHGQFDARTTGNRILVTFDKTVGGIRAFIVNNIMYYMFTGENFDRKFDVAPK